METQPPARFQFSIRLMLVATAAVAMGAGAVTTPLGWHSLPVLLLLGIAFASIAVMGAVSTQGRPRAFWIGFALAAGLAAILATAMVFGVIIDLVESDRWDEFGSSRLIKATRLSMSVLWCAGLLNGFFCVLVHRLIWPRPPEPRL
ncbi:MAG TPA: hypothetical protein VG826_13885 [Pirellulales bacterium]|nr:hypothetical protein [Pirellulales bacterium]